MIKFDFPGMRCYFDPACSIALFSSEEKGQLFVPNAEEKRCEIISSKTGKLIDIDVEAVKNAVQMLERSPVFA